jgi:3-hydroxyacyl-CoA dehydrogenase
MGVGIALALAAAEIPVTLLDRTTEQTNRGMSAVEATLRSSVRRGRLAEGEAQLRLAAITPAAEIEAVAGAEVVIEAVFEQVSVKQDVFRLIDRYADSGVVLGSNTSTLDIEQLAAATGRPEAVIGTHFFGPAQVMRLLEVIPGRQTSARTLAKVMQLGRQLGKVAVKAGNRHGFIGNAMLFDYIRQCMFLVEEGATPTAIDQVLRSFGFAMGPFAVTDMGGHDLAIQARRAAVASRPAGPRYCDLDLFLYDRGRLGLKSGAGWHRYEPGDRTPNRDVEFEAELARYAQQHGVVRRSISDEEILKRCLLSLVNRGTWLVNDGVAARASDIDVVYTAGYGFPKDQGGPLYFADSLGLPEVLADIQRFSAVDPHWWQPAPLLLELAASGGRLTA